MGEKVKECSQCCMPGLLELKKQFEQRFPQEYIEDPPFQNTLDLNKVMDSQFFFS